jgi:transposase
MDIKRDKVREIVGLTRVGPLDDDNHGQLEALMETLLWLMSELEAQRTTTRRLHRMLFGPTSEKTKDVFPEPGDDSDKEPPSGQDEDKGELDASEESSELEGGQEGDKGKRKGHGRNPASAYRGANTTCVDHESLKPGDACPECGKGKVYEQRVPAVLVRITGGAPLQAEVVKLQRLRCNLCGEVFTAKAPEGVGEDKYDENAATMIGLLKYGTGLPFNRLDRLQASLGIPLPAATQWDIVRGAARPLSPVYDELIRQGAQGEIFHNDDTKMPVLSLTGKRRAREAPSDDPPDRTGMFTTGIVAKVGSLLIALYFTGRQHAGENLTDLLKRRASKLAVPIQMCDGLSRNLPKEFTTILANCLSHGRRHFVDVADNFPSECRHVLDTLADVFTNDATARKEQMSADERLAFHQEHSGPLMDGLKKWFKEQFKQRTVEPNSGLGEAFQYMLNHWEALTLFLRRAGAPIENNVVERALKKAVLHRKNALFYRSLNGAQVGDIFMSLIHTCELCGADPFDYLVALLKHPEQITRAPGDWMPWNYQDTLQRIIAAAA